MLAMIVATLIVLLVVSGIFTKLFGRSAAGVGNQIDSAGDYDTDNIPNFQDKCPCDRGSIEFDGCNSNNPTDQQKNNRDCFPKK